MSHGAAVLVVGIVKVLLDIHPEAEPELFDDLRELREGLAPEVPELQQLRFAAPDKVGDRLDVRGPEAVVGADREFEFIDVHLKDLPDPCEFGILLEHLLSRLGFDVEAEEELDVVFEDVRALRKRIVGCDRSVRLDFENEFFVIRLLPHPGRLHVKLHVPDRSEDRVDRDHAGGLIGELVLLRRHVALAAADAELHFERGARVQGDDMLVRIEDFDFRVRLLDVGGGHILRPLQIHDDLCQLLVEQLHPHGFEVQNNLGDVLDGPRDARKFMEHTLDPDGGKRRAGKGRKQDAAEGVSDRHSEPLLERLKDKPPERVRVRRLVELNLLRHLKICSYHINFSRVANSSTIEYESRLSFIRIALLGIELDDKLFIEVQRDVRPFRDAQEGAGHCGFVETQPRKHRAVLHPLHRRMDDVELFALLADLDDIARPEQVRGDVHDLIVHHQVAVDDQLPPGFRRGGDPEPVDDIIEAALEHLDERFAGPSRFPERLFEVIAELLLHQAVHPPDLVFFTELDAVFGDLLPPVLAVLARGVRAPLHGALLRETLRALEK